MQSPPGYGGPPPQHGYGAPPPHGGYGPPPTSQTTVIVQQPTRAPARHLANTRDWSSGVCGCFEDIPSCLLVWFCQPCYQCHLSMRVNESCCVPICVPGGMIAVRTKLRAEQGIQGSICNDCIIQAFCSPCADCQLARELNYIDANHL